jgi:pyruvate,water dikinase
MKVLRFDEPACSEVASAGGKGASLARMAGLELPVPPGFVVPADALTASLGDAEAELRGALKCGASAEAAERCRALVLAAEPESELAEAVAAAHGQLGDDASVAVRSSACAEDSDAASYAGQQETYLHVRGAADVLARVRDCWASFFGERALFYREQKGSLDDLAMAVVVQRMVVADVAGVLFTCDPVRQRRDRMVVEAVFGLGEAAVSGQVTPDHYVVTRAGEVKKRHIAVQPMALVGGDDGGTAERKLSEEEGGAATLDEEQLKRLARLGDDLEEKLGRPQDIEWALENGELYVLQARPVTA